MYKKSFQNRHIGGFPSETQKMLGIVGHSTLDSLVDSTIPQSIRLKTPLNVVNPSSEFEVIEKLKNLSNLNIQAKNFIGQGYYGTIIPSVILRNILENPGWYTAYTPYQAEIAQGRLEMLLNFQTVISDLTGLEISNASLLDEATAAAEAMALLFSVKKSPAKKKFFASNALHKQTLDVLITRSEPLGIELIISEDINLLDDSFFGAIFGYPDSKGEIVDFSHLSKNLAQKEIGFVVVADLLSLCLLKAPGEFGADIVVGSAQRFGVPMGFGGPHAAFFATKSDFKRLLPGRIIGASVDAAGNKALRMALQTREQHIRRDKATSNICTAQVLLAVISAAYAIYHGKEGLIEIANDINEKANLLSHEIKSLGFKQVNHTWFDTLTFVNHIGETLFSALNAENINVYNRGDNTFSVSVDECTTKEDMLSLLAVLQRLKVNGSQAANLSTGIPSELKRNSDFLTHPTFKNYQTEHEMLRYLKRLENKDLSMVHSMISLGSCTMKLNATTEMIPVTMDGFSKLHPFAPLHQTKGYQVVFEELSKYLAEITGFEGVSLQPNSGAQGEYAGLMVIRQYHKFHHQAHRNIALIPSSAHGTNPASAVMAGMKVVVVPCDSNGNINLEDLKEIVLKHKDNLACLMVTYPSTHGVFEEDIQEICELIHQNGGLVYMDGANMNAQVGLTSPAMIGADVCHLNLHKTFCIPHGGGGPGMGPICVAKHLVDFLPGHVEVDLGHKNAVHAISAAPYGSASILLISYAYILLMGGEGLTEATKQAILKANYLRARLESHYPILYLGKNGTCAHEFILDCRSFKTSAGIEVEDIAKRLMDFGFHAPTVSFPVAGTLMIEPTESESLDELDRFADAMIAIREEIREIEIGLADRGNNTLKNAPHTQQEICSDVWEYPYSRKKAAFPKSWTETNKFWPSVKRIDGAYGDRNLVCTCEPVESYAEA
ncbi:MAG: aminomethyl-transferring glycine dehydrogenase [Cytophagales bacterium]